MLTDVAETASAMVYRFEENDKLGKSSKKAKQNLKLLEAMQLILNTIST